VSRDVPDPFAVLGVGPDASLDDIRAARRRLARDLHPDVGGSEHGMKELNAAFDAAVAHVTGRRRLDGARSGGAAGAKPAPAPSAAASSGPQERRTARRPSGGPSFRRVEHDHPSFTIDALPVEAFEALLIVTSWIGEVLVDEPPYLLDVHLYEPAECWCRLELVPDAGSSTVSITVAGIEGRAAPLVDEVRDVWVANLNQLGRWQEP